MKPEIEILGISIKTFGVAFALGFLACGGLVARRLRELGRPVDWSYEIIFAALVGGLVGARGYYLIQNYERVKHDLVGSIFSGSGLVWYGGAIGGAMGYPHGTVPTPPGVEVQPTPIYETVAMCLVAYTLWRLRDEVRPGVVFALYLILSGFERFLVEFIRRNSEVAAGLTAPQLESAFIFVAGTFWIWLLVRRGGRAAVLASPG